MINLNHSHYSLTFCNKEPVEPWILFEEDMETLKQTVRFLKSNHQKVLNYKPGHFLSILDFFNFNNHKASGDDISEDEVLSLLGIRSKGMNEGSFLNKETYENNFTSSDFVLPTERFLSSSSLNSGSGRHALTNNLQIKGLGRNSLSNQLDYSHSWGGMLPIDALKAVISDHYCLKRCLLPPAKTIAVFLYKKKFNNLKQAITYRESSTYRACQFWDDIINKDLQKIAQSHLRNTFPKMDMKEMTSTIIENYIDAFTKGVLHRTPTTENITIDGKWLDTESIDFKANPTSHDKYINIFVPGEPIKDVNNIEDLFQQTDKSKLMGSWIHDLKVPSLITYKVMENIFGTLDFEFKCILENTLEKHGLYEQDWAMLLKNFICLKEQNLHKESYNSLSPIDHKTISFANQYKCVGNFYDHYYKGNMLLFCEKEDSSRESLKILEKWNLALNKSELSFNKAMNNGHLLKQII